MLETLAAIGLASNIMQFVVYGRNLIAEGYMLYRSSDGTLADYAKLESFAKDFAQFSEKLAASPPVEDYVEETEALKKLATTSRDTAVELLLILDDLKLEGPDRISQSICQALRSSRKKDKIRSIEKKMEDLQRLLNLRLISFCVPRLVIP